MSFQIKDFLSIVASMVNHMRGTQTQLTDFNVGSVARTLVEAPAVEIDELYQQMFRGLLDAIPVSVYNSFDFGRLPAVGASGLARFSVQTPAVVDIPIPSGTAVRQTGGSYDYVTTIDAVIFVGNTYCDAMVYCTKAGNATNVAAQTIDVLSVPIPGVSVINQNAFSNGQDLESDESLKTRFREYISTISRGTVSALNYGASTSTVKDANGEVIERVKLVQVVEPYLIDPNVYFPGVVDLYIHNGSSGTSTDLVAEAQKVIDGYRDANGVPVPGWKAAGVVVNVHAADDVSINVTGIITIDDSRLFSDVHADVVASIGAYLDAAQIGWTVYLSEIITAAMNVPGVVNAVFSSPIGDVTTGNGMKPVAGDITITQA